MTERTRKPPMSIEEEGTIPKGDESKPGKLTYTSEAKPKVGNGDKKKSGVLQILLPALIAVVLAAIMVVQFTPSKGSVSSVEDKIESVAAQASSDRGRLETALTTMSDYVKRSEVASIVTGEMAGYVKSSDLGVYATDADLGLLEEEIAGISVVGSLDYSLSGTHGNYDLTISSEDEGVFVGRVTLLYSSPIPIGLPGDDLGVALQAFYSGLGSTIRSYQCGVVYTPFTTQWALTEVSFITGGFGLEAGIERTFNIVVTGLVGTFDTYSKAYIEILPGNIDAGSSGGGI